MPAWAVSAREATFEEIDDRPDKPSPGRDLSALQPANRTGRNGTGERGRPSGPRKLLGEITGRTTDSHQLLLRSLSSRYWAPDASRDGRRM